VTHFAASESHPESDAVADRRWARVRELAADIARLETADDDDALDDEGRMELARLRIVAERASARALLADELADRIESVRRGKARGDGIDHERS